MIEVEAKVQVKNSEEIRKRIKKFAKFSEKIKKVDAYYTLEDLKNYPEKSLRVRKLNGRHQVNFKQKLSYVEGVHAKRETEFEVSDIEGFLRLIDNFGFKKWLVKEKISEIYSLKKNFHIELNNVKNLGWFLEIEYLSDMKNIARARREVVEVMKKLGVSEKEIIKKGYTKMLWDKNKLSV